MDTSGSGFFIGSDTAKESTNQVKWTIQGKRCLTYCNCTLFTYFMLCLIYNNPITFPNLLYG